MFSVDEYDSSMDFLASIIVISVVDLLPGNLPHIFGSRSVITSIFSISTDPDVS